MKRLCSATLLAALGFAACATPTPQGEDRPRVAAPPAPSNGTAVSPALQSFRDNLARAQAAAENDGWVVDQTVELPGHDAAIVLYRPAKRSSEKRARMDAIGTGEYRVPTDQSGMIDVMRAPGGSLLWDLRGDHSSSVVLALTPCGANCGVAKPVVLELRGDQFFTPKSAPERPSSLQDGDHDGIPEFQYTLGRLVIAPCSRLSCGPSAVLGVEVPGLESWDGEKYARDLKALQPLYFELLKQTRHEAEGVRRAPDKAKICPLGALEVALELAVYSRLIGESRGDALTAADEVMHGYDTGPCAKEYDLMQPPSPWSELRHELERVEVPTLDRGRAH